jgi:hypothetical protein
MQASSGIRTVRTAPQVRRRGRLGPMVAVLVGLTVVVAGCGGGAAGSGGSGSSGASGGSSASPARFAQCMRGHGVPSFPDPDSSGHFSLQITKGGSLDPSSATYKSALQTCHRFDTGFGSGSGSGTNNSAALKFSQCMRSHGVTDFPDPSGGGIKMTGGVQSNPNFQSALQACRPLLSGGGS